MIDPTILSADAGLGSLQLFADEQHQPFFWAGGSPAALFIHGFLGTPAEMRPLADVLYANGWTVEGILLPGFGPQIDTLFSRRRSEWIDAAYHAARKLKEQHHPLLLVGYSMGAAVAVHVAARLPVDGLVLIAPFWQIGASWHRFVWQLVKRFFPHFKPFQRADFSDPRLQQFFQNVTAGLNLSDPAVQGVLRQVRVPTRFVDEVLALGHSAGQKASMVTTSLHMIQGTHDETVKLQQTRRLLQRFSGPLTYEEVDAGHELVKPDAAGFAQARQSLLTYAQQIAAVEIRAHTAV